MLSVVVMLFVIGLLIAIFSLMGGELQTSTYTTTTTAVVNESLTTVTNSAETLAGKSYRSAVCTVSQCINSTDAVVIPATNYTATACTVAKANGVEVLYNNTNWKCSYSYVWEADNTATNVMNDTVGGISGATDWFDIFIVITAMVVLILLVVIIITAIRSSGMVAGGDNSSGAGKVGTA